MVNWNHDRFPSDCIIPKTSTTHPTDLSNSYIIHLNLPNEWITARHNFWCNLFQEKEDKNTEFGLFLPFSIENPAYF